MDQHFYQEFNICSALNVLQYIYIIFYKVSATNIQKTL